MRVGRLQALPDLYEHCEAAGVHLYGGGMGEHGVGRGQMQLLASLFHPDAPNDIAPAATTSPSRPAPAGEPVAGGSRAHRLPPRLRMNTLAETLLIC